MRNRAGHVHTVPGLELVSVIAEPQGQTTREHVEELVEPMDVEWRSREAGNRVVFDDRELARGLVGGDLDVEHVPEDRETLAAAAELNGGCLVHEGSVAARHGRVHPRRLGLCREHFEGMLERMDGRMRRELERLAAERHDADVFYESLLALLERDGFRYDGACWHVTDPITGLLARSGVVGDLPGDFHTAIHFELFEDDVSKLDEVARRKVPVTSLVHETGGKPEASLRYRELIRPDGHADELRVVFTDPFGRWGAINIFRADEAFADTDRKALASIVPLVAQALRIAADVGRTESTTAPVPGVLVLGANDHLESADSRARALLGEPDQPALELPGAVYVAAARARRGGGPVRGRMLTPRGWLLLDASALDSSRIAVVVQPAPAASLVDVRLRSAGLTEREREVAIRVIRGDPTTEIAAALFLSPWTVQDHLKSIFEKVGVRSRHELASTIALDAATSSL